jgi:hypothetical protein
MQIIAVIRNLVHGLVVIFHTLYLYSSLGIVAHGLRLSPAL